MGAAVLAIAVAGGFGAWWWTHPTAFRDLGDSFALQPRPVDEAVLSTTVIFPKVDGEPETVTIDSLGPVFSKNTARATAAFSICHLSPGEDPIGAAHDPAEFCQDLDPSRRERPSATVSSPTATTCSSPSCPPRPASRGSPGSRSAIGWEPTTSTSAAPSRSASIARSLPANRAAGVGRRRTALLTDPAGQSRELRGNRRRRPPRRLLRPERLVERVQLRGSDDQIPRADRAVERVQLRGNDN